MANGTGNFVTESRLSARQWQGIDVVATLGMDPSLLIFTLGHGMETAARDTTTISTPACPCSVHKHSDRESPFDTEESSRECWCHN